MTEEHHNFQWGQTAHFGKQLTYLAKTSCRHAQNIRDLTEREKVKEKLNKLFLESEAFASVKFDGTNVGKCAISGQMLGRRLVIQPGTTRYQKASLDGVIEAKVDVVRDTLMKDVGDALGELVVYGELMCNKNLYDYSEQCLHEEWLVFGAIAQDNSQTGDLLENLIKAGYAASKYEDADEDKHDEIETGEKKRIKIFLNGKFVEIVEKAGMRTAKMGVVGKGTLTQVVEGNKEWMKSGEGEGLVISLGSPEVGFQLLKWKGQQEHQPSSNDAVKSVVVEAQELGCDDRILNVFKLLLEVIEAGPKTPKNAKAKVKVEKDKVCVTENEVEAVKSAMTKFDDAESYFEKSMKMEYEKLIFEEALKDVNAEDEKIRKALNMQVKKVVGNLYGQFKRKQK